VNKIEKCTLEMMLEALKAWRKKESDSIVGR